MSDNNFYSAPAGWYPDPLGLPQLRWWDSTQWTHQVAEARQPMVMQETTFKWADDEPDQEQELSSRRERRERDRRDPVDTPAPTAQTLLQLDAPKREDVIQNTVANPEYRTESPVSDAGAAAAAQQAAQQQAAQQQAAQQQAQQQPAPQQAQQQQAPQQQAQQQQQQAPAPQHDESPLFDSLRRDGQPAEQPAAQQPVQPPVQPTAQQQGQPQYEDPNAPQQQGQQYAAQPQQGNQQQGQPQNYGQSQQGQPQQYGQPQAQPQPAQPQQYAGQPQQQPQSQPGNYYDAPVYGQQVNEPQAAQYGYLQQFQGQPQAAPWVLHQGQALPDRPDFRVIHTAAVWVMALLPLLQLVVSLLLLTAFGVGANQPLMLAVWLIPYPITVLLAYVDQRALIADGRQHTAHWAFALAGAPVYLIVRAISSLREAGKGFGPELAWIGLSVLLLGSIVAVPGLAIATAPDVFANEAANSVIADAAANGNTLAVTCPPSPPVIFGQIFYCEGVGADGSILNIEVSLQRVNGWIAWRVNDWGIYVVG